MSHNAIAKIVGCSDHTVKSVYDALVSTSQIAKSETRKGADGREINVAKIGRNRQRRIRWRTRPPHRNPIRFLMTNPRSPRTRTEEAPPKQFPRSHWLRQWHTTIGPLVRLVNKIAEEVRQKHGKHHRAVKEHLNHATEEMTEWLEEEGYGKCPNCLGTKWAEDDEGLWCAKCHHPHGEPAGDVDKDRIRIQRQKTVKTAEALMRAFDDLNYLKPSSEHKPVIDVCRSLVKTAKEWTA